MSKILVWMSPEPTHILPTLKMALDLKERGHEVAYHTTSGFREPIQRLGFGYHPFLSDAAETPGRNGLYGSHHTPEDWHAMLLRQFGGDRVRAYTAVSESIAAAASATDADLVLVDSTMNYLYGIRADRAECAVSFVQTHLPLILFGRNMARSRRFLERAVRTIVLCPAELEVSEFYVETARYAEASIHLDRDEMAFPWEWLDSDRRLIFCSFGSQSHLYPEALGILRAVVEAARRMPEYQFVLAAGSHGEALVGGPGPSANCRIFTSVPQTPLLDRASVMISHGGLGSVKECIYFGVPNLVVPFLNDQPLNAMRVCHHGLGVRLEASEVNAARLKIAIQQLLTSEEVRTNVRRMQAIFRVRESQPLAATICEEILTGYRATRRS